VVLQVLSKRHKWVVISYRIDAGDVEQVIRTLKEYQGQGRSASLIYLSISSDLEMLSTMTNSVLRFTHRFGRGWRDRIYSPKAPKDSRSYLASRYG